MLTSPTQCKKLEQNLLCMVEFTCLTYGSVSTLWQHICKFHGKVFLHFLLKLKKYLVIGNLRMSHPLSTYGSISETGEFGLHVKIIIFYTESTRKVDLLSCLTSEKYADINLSSLFRMSKFKFTKYK